jgi:hypothetical protein
MIEEYEKYISEIEQTVINYEGMLISNSNVIEDLQNQVVSYMKDAIEKENEN